jgi:AmiR/NasT family two-component response regulator
MLRAVLEGEGLSIVGEAGNGEEALGMVQGASPDVVLMDIRMPGMGGIEAARLIKEASPFTQVLMLTSYDGPLPTRSAHQVGAYAYLVEGLLCRVDPRRHRAGMEIWGWTPVRSWRATVTRGVGPSGLSASPTPAS